MSTWLNSDVNADFTIDGVGGYVAVIIAPGDALSSQDRTVKTTPANYLESVNVTDGGTDRAFVNANPADPDNFNDVVLGITWSEIMTAMTLKVVQEIKSLLDEYHDSTYTGLTGSYIEFPYYPYTDANYGNWRDDWEFGDMMRHAQTGWPSPWSQWAFTFPDDFDWYQDSSVDEDGDRWNGATSYTRLNNDSAQISFTGCAIIFTVTHDAGITRDRPSC